MAKLHTVFAFALLSAFAATPVFAGDKNDTPPSANMAPRLPNFDQVDFNGNGMLDRDEFSRGTTNQTIVIAQVDTDGDGQVSRAEWDAKRKGKDKAPEQR